VGHHTGKAANYAAAQAAKDAQTDAAAATASTDTATADAAAAAAVDPAHWYNKPPKWRSKYYRNPVPDSCSPLRPGYAADIRDASLTANGYPPSRVKASDVNFNGFNNADGLGTTCTVNGELFSFPDPNPLVLEMGEIVQWTTDNARSHPLHVHTQPFQLTSFNLSNQLIGTALTNFFQVGCIWWNRCQAQGICCSQFLQRMRLHYIRRNILEFSGSRLRSLHCYCGIKHTCCLAIRQPPALPVA
jgi:hypothetical protein